ARRQYSRRARRHSPKSYRIYPRPLAKIESRTPRLCLPMLVASIVPHVSSWLQSQVGASALGALAQRESTCLAGKGSAVRIRHAPPVDAELRFGTQDIRVLRISPQVTPCQQQVVAGALKRALNFSARRTQVFLCDTCRHRVDHIRIESGSHV